MFNIRVYGLWIIDDQILLSEERIKHTTVIKFPGGGLEFGEGLLDGLKREFQEELHCEISIKEHFYTTDFFVQSAFNKDDQVISIYYLVEAADLQNNFMKSFSDNIEDEQRFFWKQIDMLNASDFYFPIDKVVVQKLQSSSLNKL